jgi:hypothetical protein
MRTLLKAVFMVQKLAKVSKTSPDSSSKTGKTREEVCKSYALG